MYVCDGDSCVLISTHTYRTNNQMLCVPLLEVNVQVLQRLSMHVRHTVTAHCPGTRIITNKEVRVCVGSAYLKY